MICIDISSNNVFFLNYLFFYLYIFFQIYHQNGISKEYVLLRYNYNLKLKNKVKAIFEMPNIQKWQ